MQNPATQNADHGFFAAIASHRNPTLAWNTAMERIVRVTGCEEYEVRAFLDSTFGPIFAQDIASALSPNGSIRSAVDAVITNWMRRRLQESERRSWGILEARAGIPYLVAAVYTASCFEMADA